MKSGVARSWTSGGFTTHARRDPHATHAAVADAGLMQDDAAPLSYGDLRVRSDRRRGVCLFWVVPDVSPGFNVPDFYEAVLRDQREYEQQQRARKQARRDARGR